MSNYEQKEGQGSLFRNDKKGNEKAPDYRGQPKNLKRMSPVTTSLSELIEQLDKIIEVYKPHQLNYSDGTRGYVNGLKEARHLAQNLLNREL